MTHSSVLSRAGGWLALAFITVALASASAEDLPDMRPAFMANGPSSLANLIDGKGLIARGQGDAILLFSCFVMPDGVVASGRAYRESTGGDLLKNEVNIKLKRAHFVPAVYNHRRSSAYFQGTVMFKVIDGKPRVRVFANQEISELKQEGDFISPEAIYIQGHHYDFPPYPATPWASEDKPAVVDLTMTIDATGKLLDVHVLDEHPPGKKFGEVAIKQEHALTFLPAYRNGRPVASTTHVNLVFFPGGWHWK